MNTSLVGATVFNAPVWISLALSGYLLHIFPYSDMCKDWSVPERNDVSTDIAQLLFSNTSSHTLSVITLYTGLPS